MGRHGQSSNRIGTPPRPRPTPTRRIWVQSRDPLGCWLIPDRGLGVLVCWGCQRRDARDYALMVDITRQDVALCPDCLSTLTGRPVLMGQVHPEARL